VGEQVATAAPETEPDPEPPADGSWAVEPVDEPLAAAWATQPSSVVLGTADAGSDEEPPTLDPEPWAHPARPAADVAATSAPPVAAVIGAPPASLDLPPAVVASFAGAMPITPSTVHTPGTPFAAPGSDDRRSASAVPRVGPVRLPALELGELPRQLVVAGAAVAAVSFALPWGSSMIGAPSLGQPWITLGIMGSWHILALAAVLGTAVLAVRGTRFGPWFRIGVVPLLVCGDLLGLAWPYLTTSLGRGVGVYAVLVGAIAMGVGAVLALRAATRPMTIRTPERNAAPAPTV
jgi:hypothetical protein